jgi:hypothetical protein
MNSEEALDLLGSNLDARLIRSKNTTSTRQLLDLLTNLLLAIKQASTYINKIQITSIKYLGIYLSNSDGMIRLLSYEFPDDGRYVTDDRRYDIAKTSVISTFFVSFDQIQHVDPLAADCLRLMSFLAEHDISHKILPLANKPVMIEAISWLKAYTFISERHTDLFDIHRLVQALARVWMKERKEWDKALGGASNRLNEIFRISEQENREVWVSYLPHALSVLKFGQGVDDQWAVVELLRKTGLSLNEVGKYEQGRGDVHGKLSGEN